MVSTKNIANAVSGKTARACDSCIRKRARWYCAADDAFLCQSCDSDVHSANSLARRHERVRLKSASFKSTLPPSPPQSHVTTRTSSKSIPSWHKGFTKKARTPRPGNSVAVRRQSKSDEVLSFLPNPFFPLVPEADETTSSREEEEQLLYRVPVFDDPFAGDNEGRVVDSENLHGGFLPSDMDLAEFAADVESLLGRNLENECFDMEGLGLIDCEEKDMVEKGCSLSGGRVKMEEEGEEGGFGKKFEAEIDLMREPFELNFEDYDDDVPGSCCEEDEKMGVGTAAGVKNEGETYGDELKKMKKKKVGLSLDCDAVIAAWGGDRSPWTTGERPEFSPDDCWPNCMAICGVSYRHSCGDLGIFGGHSAAMVDGGREARVSRYREKRRTRLFSKKIRYEVRKLNAEKRPRMKGRFVKRTPFAPPSLPILSIK